MLNSYNLYIDKLNPDYKESFKKISDYVHASNADEIKNEEILSEVMDSFLEAQNAGRNVDQVTGNLESFCKQLCSEIGMKSRILNLLEAIFPMFVIYGLICIEDIIDVIIRLSDGEKVRFLNYRGSGDIRGYMIGAMLFLVTSYIYRRLIRKYIFSNPDKHRRISFAGKLVTTLIFVGGLIYFHKESLINETRGTLLWISILFCALFLIGYRRISRESRRYRKENKISISELYGSREELLEDIEKAEMKTMARINAKRARKGEPPMSLKEFIEYEKEGINKWHNKPLFYILLIAGVTTIATVFTFATVGFESTTDLVFFIIIILACESPLMYLMYKAPRLWHKDYLKKWIDKKETEIGE